MTLPQKIIIKQEKDMLEVFTNFETRNRYADKLMILATAFAIDLKFFENPGS